MLNEHRWRLGIRRHAGAQLSTTRATRRIGAFHKVALLCRDDDHRPDLDEPAQQRLFRGAGRAWRTAATLLFRPRTLAVPSPSP